MAHLRPCGRYTHGLKPTCSHEDTTFRHDLAGAAAVLTRQVRDVDAIVGRLSEAGARLVGIGGTPDGNGGTTRVTLVRDTDNLFLELIQTAQ